MYLSEENGDTVVGIKVSGYVPKFSHWRSNGEGESIQ